MASPSSYRPPMGPDDGPYTVKIVRSPAGHIEARVVNADGFIVDRFYGREESNVMAQVYQEYGEIGHNQEEE